MIATTSRAHERAIAETEAALTSIDSAIADVAEQLEAARDEAGRLNDAWDQIGEEMAAERQVAVDPYVTNEHAHRARERFEQLADRRIALLEPRQQAMARVVDCQRRLAFLKRHRERGTERLAALLAGTLEPDPIAEASEPDQPDVSPEPAVAAVAPGGSAGPGAAPFAAVQRWWGW